MGGSTEVGECSSASVTHSSDKNVLVDENINEYFEHGLNMRHTNTINKNEINTKDLNSNRVISSYISRDNDASNRLRGSNMNCVHSDYWEEHIINGYRASYMSPGECLRSLLYANNESMNVWTHLIAFCLLSIKFARVFSYEVPLADPSSWPLLLLALGMLWNCMASSLAHTFQCMSLPVLHACFCLDYSAICIYSVTAGQAYYWYTRPLENDVWILRWPVGFGIASVMASLGGTIGTCYTRYNRDCYGYKAIIRVTAFLLPFVVNTSPYFCRMACLGRESSSTCEPTQMGHLWLLLSAVLCYSLRIPERFQPGLFDRCGHSHNIMHALVAAGMWLQFDMAQFDMQNHAIALRHDAMRYLTFGNSVVFALVALALNLVVARWFYLRIREKVKKGE